MPDALPFRLRVLRAMTATLKTVTPANGFVANLSDFEEDGATRSRVYRGLDEFGPSDPRPLVNILEHPRALEQTQATGGGTSRTGDWDLLIQGFVQDDHENPTDPAHMLVADVIAALAREKRVNEGNLFGEGDRKPCVTDIKIGAQVVRPADGDISDVAFFFLTVTLVLVEDLENPFA